MAFFVAPLSSAVIWILYFKRPVGGGTEANGEPLPSKVTRTRYVSGEVPTCVTPPLPGAVSMIGLGGSRRNGVKPRIPSTNTFTFVTVEPCGFRTPKVRFRCSRLVSPASGMLERSLSPFVAGTVSLSMKLIETLKLRLSVTLTVVGSTPSPTFAVLASTVTSAGPFCVSVCVSSSYCSSPVEPFDCQIGSSDNCELICRKRRKSRAPFDAAVTSTYHQSLYWLCART